MVWVFPMTISNFVGFILIPFLILNFHGLFVGIKYLGVISIGRKTALLDDL